jgi:hypothetical protein
MAYINLLTQEKHIWSHDRPKNFKQIKSIRVSKAFLSEFDIEGGKFQYIDMYGYNSTLKQLRRWIEDRVLTSYVKKPMLMEYEEKQIKFAEDKLLPILEIYNDDLIVDIEDMD